MALSMTFCGISDLSAAISLRMFSFNSLIVPGLFLHESQRKKIRCREIRRSWRLRKLRAFEMTHSFNSCYRRLSVVLAWIWAVALSCWNDISCRLCRAGCSMLSIMSRYRSPVIVSSAPSDVTPYQTVHLLACNCRWCSRCGLLSPRICNILFVYEVIQLKMSFLRKFLHTNNILQSQLMVIKQWSMHSCTLLSGFDKRMIWSCLASRNTFLFS